MKQSGSSVQHSHGDEGKKKNERKGVNTNPFHEVSNSSPGFSDSKPIGKKFKADEDFDQADVKNQWKSSEPKVSEQNGSGKINPNPSQRTKKRKNRRDKRNRFLVETESEDEEYEDQNEYSDHFDNSNSDFQKYDDERDENLEDEAEKVEKEDEHENVTPEATNEPLNPFNDKDFDKDPDSNKNPSSSTEDDPFVMQPESGYRSVPNSSKTKDGNGSNDQSNQKSAGNSNFNAYDHSNSHGDRRGHPNPQVGIKRLGFSQNKPMGHG
jgi:hypothetical protein